MVSSRRASPCPSSPVSRYRSMMATSPLCSLSPLRILFEHDLASFLPAGPTQGRSALQPQYLESCMPPRPPCSTTVLVTGDCCFCSQTIRGIIRSDSYLDMTGVVVAIVCLTSLGMFFLRQRCAGGDEDDVRRRLSSTIAGASRGSGGGGGGWAGTSLRGSRTGPLAFDTQTIADRRKPQRRSNTPQHGGLATGGGTGGPGMMFTPRPTPAP